MKTKIKVLIIAVSIIVVMLVLPWAATELDEGFATTGLWFLAFFTVNPLLVIVLSIMAGTELRKLWCVPLIVAAVFPLLFSLAIRDMVWDLYVYSAIYLPIGILAMLGTHFGIKLGKKRIK